MAEGLLRVRGGDRFLSYSAGTRPSRVHPMAVQVMWEIGIDVSAHRSKHVDDYCGHPMDYVVTVCDSARESCPYVPAVRHNMHHTFDDPSRVTGSEEVMLTAFRRVRDEIRQWIEQTFLHDEAALG